MSKAALALSGAELDAVVAAVPWTDGPTLRWAKTNRAIADAATDNALRVVVKWLRTYGPREDFVANELEAMLNEEGGMKLQAGDIVEVRYNSGARWGIVESMRDEEHAIICFEFEERIAEEQRLVNPRSQEALVEA